MDKLNENLEKTALITNILLDIKPEYVWWNSDMKDCGPQAYSESNEDVNFENIKKKGINCVGLINIIRRSLDLEIAGFGISNYAGGTYEWYKYLKKNKKLEKINFKKSYPYGTLLIRKYKNEYDQGHLGIVQECNHNETILDQKLLHAYALENFDENNPNKHIKPGLTIDNKVKISHNWFDKGTYTHICLPENWLV